MKLPRFLQKLLGLDRGRKRRRDGRLSRIEELGFTVDDRSGTYKGKVADRRYFLIAKSGKVLDNDGEGFASSSEAYRAALMYKDDVK